MRSIYKAVYGRKVDLDKCRVSVHRRVSGLGQCTREAKNFEVVKGERSRVGFCAQHTTKAIEKRAARRTDLYAAEAAYRDRCARLAALRYRAFDAIRNLTPKQAKAAGLVELKERIAKALDNK